MGEVISRSAMRDVVDIMALLRVTQEKGKRGIKSIYENDFEPVFLKKSEQFYTEEAESSLQTLDASTYLRLVGFLLLTTDDIAVLTIFLPYRSSDGYAKNTLDALHISLRQLRMCFYPSSTNIFLRNISIPFSTCQDRV